MLCFLPCAARDWPLAVDAGAQQDHRGAGQDHQDTQQLLRGQLLMQEEDPNKAADHRHQQQRELDQPDLKML